MTEREVDSLIRETLKPLVDKQAVIKAEIADLKGQVSEKRETLNKIKGLLVRGGLESATSQPMKKAKPRFGPERFEIVKAAALSQGKPFYAREIGEQTKTHDLSVVNVVLRQLHKEGELVLVGKKRPPGNTGHMRAVYYEVPRDA